MTTSNQRKASKKWKDKNRVKLAAQSKKWREDNPEKLKAYNKSDKFKESQNKYIKKRRKEDPVYAMAARCRARIHAAMKRGRGCKSRTTTELLGCDFEHLIKHIESQFIDGMTIDNRSEWHIDHIIPLASAKTVEEIEKLCHYTNLQPLWADDNLKKGGKQVI